MRTMSQRSELTKAVEIPDEGQGNKYERTTMHGNTKINDLPSKGVFNTMMLLTMMMHCIKVHANGFYDHVHNLPSCSVYAVRVIVVCLSACQ